MQDEGQIRCLKLFIFLKLHIKDLLEVAQSLLECKIYCCNAEDQEKMEKKVQKEKEEEKIINKEKEKKRHVMKKKEEKRWTKISAYCEKRQ